MTTDPESFLVAFAWPHADARRLESCDTLTGPFLRQCSRNLRELLGHDVWIAGPLEFRQVNEPDGGVHLYLAGDSAWVGCREPGRLRTGPRLPGPKPAPPLVAELAGEVATTELARRERSVLS